MYYTCFIYIYVYIYIYTHMYIHIGGSRCPIGGVRPSSPRIPLAGLATKRPDDIV